MTFRGPRGDSRGGRVHSSVFIRWCLTNTSFRYYAAGTDSFLHCVDFCIKDYDHWSGILNSFNCTESRWEASKPTALR